MAARPAFPSSFLWIGSSMPLHALEHDYAALPQRCYAHVRPTPAPAPSLLALNTALAAELGLAPDDLASPLGLATLAGSVVPPGAKPLAMAYAGHQFGHFVPRLGDGRAILLGELRAPDGSLRDVQLKGAGRTPFSRGGDGRNWLGPVLREYVISEAMHALGVPTTRALAAVATGDTVLRERPRPGAVLTRVAQSHVRVGTFEYFACRDDVDALRALVDYVLARHFPDDVGAASPALALLARAVSGQAELVARWLSLGFVHGVMNTDNCSVVGDTIDYGPCAFLDAYHPEKVFSSIDRGGRYAFGNQPHIAQWNLMVLAQCLVPLLNEHELTLAEAAVNAFAPRFDAAYSRRMHAKLGLEADEATDAALIDDLLARMADGEADFHLVFRALSELDATPSVADDALRRLFRTPAAIDPWLDRWRERLRSEARTDSARQRAMRAVNPAIIPRNHNIEAMIDAALQGDLAPLHRLIQALRTPFELGDYADLARPPAPHQVVTQTFCGT